MYENVIFGHVHKTFKVNRQVFKHLQTKEKNIDTFDIVGIASASAIEHPSLSPGRMKRLVRKT
jgi:ABC-type phosphate/phosphonate transport system ATPase subunit